LTRGGGKVEFFFQGEGEKYTKFVGATAALDLRFIRKKDTNRKKKARRGAKIG